MRLGLALAGIALLSGCGGGDEDGPQPAPPAPAGAPVFTSPLATNVPENSAAAQVVYQAVATDPNNDALTFTIVGGADAARFVIQPGGALSFVASPDFEAPADANADNFYEVTLQASDGALTARLTLVITVTNVPDLVSSRAIGGYTDAVHVTPVPGSNDVFVAQRDGRVFRLGADGTGPGTLYLSMSGLSPLREDAGVLSIVAAPDFGTSGSIYAYVRADNGDLELRRYGRLASGLADPASADVLLRIRPPSSGSLRDGARGGGLAFGPDGNLYLGVGIAGANDAQDLSTLFGKLLRLDVSGDDFAADPDRDYRIPAGNPPTTGRREVFAYGLENPRTMSFDGANLLIGDSHIVLAGGSGESQEIHLLRPQDAGANFGSGSRASGAPVVPPVITYRGSRLSNFGAVAAGFVYRGPIQSLAGQFFFAEPERFIVWSVPASSIVQGSTLGEDSFADQRRVFAPAGTDPLTFGFNISKFGLDAAGSIYVVYKDGSLQKIELR